MTDASLGKIESVNAGDRWVSGWVGGVGENAVFWMWTRGKEVLTDKAGRTTRLA